MFIKKLSDEQILELRLTLSTDDFISWTAENAHLQIIGWVSIDPSDKVPPGVFISGHMFYQVNVFFGNNYTLSTEGKNYSISADILNKISQGKRFAIDNLILNPEGEE